jgi:GH25 family lysozyme M1 (1,4-beta-N-acetylmuramidase)
MNHGVDVSGAQDTIDWSLARDEGKADFAYCKATEGWGYVSSGWRRHSTALNQVVSIARGPYHMAVWWFSGRRRWMEQVDHLCQTVEPLYRDYQWELRPLIDLESHTYKSKAEKASDVGERSQLWPAAAVCEWIGRFLEEVERRLGGASLYTTGIFAQYRLKPAKAAYRELCERWPVIMADYKSDGTDEPEPGEAPPDIKDWGPVSYAGWQWTGKGSIVGYTARPGYNPHVDRIVTADLDKLLLP